LASLSNVADCLILITVVFTLKTYFLRAPQNQKQEVQIPVGHIPKTPVQTHQSDEKKQLLTQKALPAPLNARTHEPEATVTEIRQGQTDLPDRKTIWRIFQLIIHNQGKTAPPCKTIIATRATRATTVTRQLDKTLTRDVPITVVVPEVMNSPEVLGQVPVDPRIVLLSPGFSGAIQDPNTRQQPVQVITIAVDLTVGHQMARNSRKATCFSGRKVAPNSKIRGVGIVASQDPMAPGQGTPIVVKDHLGGQTTD